MGGGFIFGQICMTSFVDVPLITNFDCQYWWTNMIHTSSLFDQIDFDLEKNKSKWKMNKSLAILMDNFSKWTEMFYIFRW